MGSFADPFQKTPFFRCRSYQRVTACRPCNVQMLIPPEYFSVGDHLNLTQTHLNIRTTLFMPSPPCGQFAQIECAFYHLLLLLYTITNLDRGNCALVIGFIRGTSRGFKKKHKFCSMPQKMASALGGFKKALQVVFCRSTQTRFGHVLWVSRFGFRGPLAVTRIFGL